MTPALDLVLFLLATYGLSWLLVKAKISLPLRDHVDRRWPIFVSDLFDCIVCTGVWIALGLALLSPYIHYFSPWLHPQNALDILVLEGLWIVIGWTLAVLLKDAD